MRPVSPKPCIDGKSSVPVVPAGEDEFVELDEEGQPRRKSAARGPRKAANVRRKAPARARVPAAAAPAETASAAELAGPSTVGTVERRGARRPGGRRGDRR